MLRGEVYLPISLVYSFFCLNNHSVSPVDYVYDLWNKMSEIQEYVRTHLGIAAERQKRDYHTCVSSK